MVSLLAAAISALALAAGSAAGRAPGDPHVLLIGDSVASELQWNADAVTIVQRGLAFDWQVAVCRRLVETSCPFDGSEAPTLLDVVSTLGSVPPTVVVEMGYNDPEETFAADVQTTLHALFAAGAKHVLWLTLRAVRDPYPALDAILAGAAASEPRLRLVDWNALSGNHPEWFQGDGIHLDHTGALAMAHAVHGAVMSVVDPLHELPARLPKLRVGRLFAVKLHAAGGTPPYRFQIASGAPPRGLHLLLNGRIYGTPRTRAALRFSVRVTDADGSTAVIPLREKSST